MNNKLRILLEEKWQQYDRTDFISGDPVSIPHRFSRKQDIEIAGLFAALLAWGTRTGIINSCNRLLERMDQSPYDFISHTDFDNDTRCARLFKGFVHRTFNESDLWHLLSFLQHHYLQSPTLETAFSQWMQPEDSDTGNALQGFHQYVFNFSIEAREEKHCRKHIATPDKKSACKRLNMYLRWNVRQDKNGVDFGIWKKILPSQLICPLDVHVSRVARRLGILQRTQNDWQAAVELTEQLRQLDPADPVKYDFALFGLGVMEKY
jgi:uncharacterized protein (TIGR02757 family)